jgi:DNA-binding transcriptional LysR family regulator
MVLMIWIENIDTSDPEGRNLELHHLKTFKTVADMGGFTRAAEALGYAQSTITSHIQALENELGRPLFDRLGKTVVLTSAGERLYEYAVQILYLAKSAVSAVADDTQPAGTLVIGAPESLMAYRLPAIMRDYKERYPNVQIVLSPSQCWESFSKLRTGELDLAFLLVPAAFEPDMHVETLLAEPMALIATPDHPLKSRNCVYPEDLVNETLLKTEKGCSYRHCFEDQLKSVHPAHEIEFWSIEAIKQCVMVGLGIAYLPRITVESELNEGKLIALSWYQDQPVVLTQMVYHKNKWLSPALRAFIDVVRRHAAQWQEREKSFSG